MNLLTLDTRLISFFRRYFEPMARIAIFVVYGWFGMLKLLMLSPAEGLVTDLLLQTMPFIHPDLFLSGFGGFEVLIGVLFLVRGAERIVMPLLLIHLVTTVMPLFILPAVTWSAPFVPTLVGQYIIKNILIIACAMGIAAHLHTLKERIPTTRVPAN